MKRRLIIVITAAAVLLALLCASAFAAEDPLKVAMQLSTMNFTAPQTVNVSIQVSNISDSDMPGPMTLYDPDDNQIEGFGSPTLAVGASKTWEGTWDVTQSQLEAGKITFKLRYSVYNDEGKLVSKTRSFHKPITYEGAVTSVEVNRTITPTVAGNGQEVTVTYEIINTGTVDITDVTIAEDKSISSKKGTIASVPAGSKKSYAFTVKMGKKDLTSKAVITYKASGATQTVNKDAAVIRYGEMHLSASLSADKKGGAPGDKAELTLTLKNSGKTDYTGVTVTDPVLGEVFTGETVPAGKTVTLEKEVTIADTVSYQFTAETKDGSGNDVQVMTGEVTLTAVSADEVITMSVNAEADREVVYELPGTVKFRVAVTNTGSVDVKNVAVKASGVTLYTFPVILAGETREFTRDVSVSMAGQYQFTASAKNQLNETVSFTSNIIYIAHSEPTAVPTDAPIVTPPVPKLEPVPTEAEVDESMNTIEQALHIGMLVFAALAAVGAVLLLVTGIIKASAAMRSAKAVDHLERAMPRDYNRPNSGENDIEEPEEETPSDDEQV